MASDYSGLILVIVLGVIPAAIALIRGKPATAGIIFVAAVGLVIFTSQGATQGTCRLGCLICDLR